MTRRSLLLPAAASVVGLRGISLSAQTAAQPVARKGRLRQTATRGCFGTGVSMEQCCKIAVQVGLKGLDVQGGQAADFEMLKKYGLVPVLIAIPDEINRKEVQETAIQHLRTRIDVAAAGGVPIVCMHFGARTGMTDEEGIENSLKVLNQVKAVAEDKAITLVLQVFNSKVNHPNNQADHTKWVVEIIKRINSPRVKLLYDCYHMQIMEGDIIRTIRDNIQYIGHFHAAGVPSRAEIDETQELNYRAIAQAVVDLNYTGWWGYEYNPVGDPVKGLEKAVAICDV